MRFLRHWLCFLPGVLTSLGAGTPISSNRPNVVFIVADDMNGYGFYGQLPGVKVPNLDAFKRTAVTFTHAYCAAPSCVPSRAAFLSGLYPHTTGSYLNGSDPWDKPVMAGIDSLPEVFKASGYETWGAGKTFHAKITAEREHRAWDNQPHAGGFGPFVPEQDQLAGKWWGATPWTGPDTDFPDVTNAAAAAEFLRAKHERPFFLMLGLWRPHTPFTAPKRFFDLYDKAKISFPPPGYRPDDLADVPEPGRALSRVWGERWRKTGAQSPAQWREILWGYLATTSFADWSAGQVLAALDASQNAANTVVIFISDNGYHCGEKDHFEKSTLWEDAAAVPLAIRLPGGSHAGSTCPGTVSLVDLFPTLVDLCRLQHPRQALDGRSLRPLLDNPAGAWDRPAITEYEVGFFSARDERYRYIQYPDKSEELYDHGADPYEFQNLGRDQREQPLKDKLQRSMPEKWAASLGGREG